MKVACFIPIKAHSERVPGKNLRLMNGKSLYKYICEHAIESDVFDDVYVDTDSNEIAEYAKSIGFHHLKREEYLLEKNANGNDLMDHHFRLFPGYDAYFQIFATAPFLQPESIKKCVEELADKNQHYDSCFTATENNGWFWLNRNPVNFRPCILPRSQDATPVIEETTGLYGINAEAFKRYKCRIGANPYIHVVNKFEAVDIDTEDDFKLAEYIGKMYWGT